MFSTFLGWLRSRVKAAVIQGVVDAMAEIDEDDGPATDEALALLRKRLALPAPEPEAPAGNGRRRVKAEG
jgi:hypothetical protein